MRHTITYNSFKEVQALNLSPKTSIRVSLFLTELVRRQVIRNKYRSNENGEYFSVKDLQAFLTKDNYLRTLRTLLGAGLIQNGFAKEGISVRKQYKNSLGKHGKPLHFYITKLSPIETGLTVPKSYKNICTEVGKLTTKKLEKLSKAARAQIPSLRRTRFVMSLTEMIKAAENHYPKYLEKKAIASEEPLTVSEYVETIKLLHIQMQAFNNAISGPEIYNYIIEDTFSGRVHSIVTSVPSYIREKAIQIDNKPVCELDMQAAGPTILGHILESCVPGNSFSSKIFSSEDIYKSMIGTMGIKDRNQAKQKMYSLLYGEVTSRGHKQFTKQYHDIGEWLYQIKTVKDPRNRSSKVHSNLARIVQLNEVKLFSEIWLQFKSKKIFFNSIHDAILIPKRDKEQAHIIMVGVLSRHLRHFQIHS